MGFNKFNKADGIRILVILFLIAVVYLSFGSTLWSGFKHLIFRMPISPPTLTATPMATQTNTPSPTFTPAPTGTFTATPIPTSMFMPGNVISFWNEFDNTDLLRGDWVFSPNVKVKDGLLIIEASEDWSGVYGNSHLRDGQSIFIRFRFDNWSDIHIAIETGEFETDSYRSWGVGAENNIFSPTYSEGTIEYYNTFTPDEPEIDDLELDPDTWYVLRLHIGGSEPFVSQIWEYSNPDKRYNLEVSMDETWQEKQWLPLFLVGPEGRLEIERYEELKGR